MTVCCHDDNPFMVEHFPTAIIYIQIRISYTAFSHPSILSLSLLYKIFYANDGHSFILSWRKCVASNKTKLHSCPCIKYRWQLFINFSVIRFELLRFYNYASEKKTYLDHFNKIHRSFTSPFSFFVNINIRNRTQTNTAICHGTGSNFLFKMTHKE